MYCTALHCAFIYRNRKLIPHGAGYVPATPNARGKRSEPVGVSIHRSEGPRALSHRVSYQTAVTFGDPCTPPSPPPPERAESESHETRHTIPSLLCAIRCCQEQMFYIHAYSTCTQVYPTTNPFPYPRRDTRRVYFPSSPLLPSPAGRVNTSTRHCTVHAMNHARRKKKEKKRK